MYLKLGIFLLTLLMGLLSYTRIGLSTRTYVGVSQIQGEGLFANQSFKRGDVILEDLFPHRHPYQVLYDPPPNLFPMSSVMKVVKSIIVEDGTTAMSQQPIITNFNWSRLKIFHRIKKSPRIMIG